MLLGANTEFMDLPVLSKKSELEARLGQWCYLTGEGAIRSRNNMNMSWLEHEFCIIYNLYNNEGFASSGVKCF